jgi:hypothetical protein
MSRYVKSRQKAQPVYTRIDKARSIDETVSATLQNKHWLWHTVKSDTHAADALAYAVAARKRAQPALRGTINDRPIGMHPALGAPYAGKKGLADKVLDEALLDITLTGSGYVRFTKDGATERIAPERVMRSPPADRPSEIVLVREATLRNKALAELRFERERVECRDGVAQPQPTEKQIRERMAALHWRECGAMFGSTETAVLLGNSAKLQGLEPSAVLTNTAFLLWSAMRVTAVNQLQENLFEEKRMRSNRFAELQRKVADPVGHKADGAPKPGVCVVTDMQREEAIAELRKAHDRANEQRLAALLPAYPMPVFTEREVEAKVQAMVKAEELMRQCEQQRTESMREQAKYLSPLGTIDFEDFKDIMRAVATIVVAGLLVALGYALTYLQFLPPFK